ncbi:MAG: 3-deoxy-8-phosphooctulonate synthase [Candidatus Omnitrophica bacterium]|nr:3-deoxy-8-phosphooctulonate synthase [Candidatus Omnitrophota bacterium]
MKSIRIGDIQIGGKNPLVLIAGPCVVEDRATTLKIAAGLKRITDKLKVPLIFKASYDKANRTSLNSYRGPGITAGLEVLEEVKYKYGVPVISDVHNIGEVDQAARVLDVLQIPAFLCRQTDLLVCAGSTGKVVNIKKGQFLAPENMRQAAAKVASTGNKRILLTERGASFGYNNLVTDFRALAILRECGYPVVLDASHSVQQPGGLGHASGGRREFIPLLARCGVAAGCDGIFMEVHTDPTKALSDGPNMLPLRQLEKLLADLVAIDRIVRKK